MTHEERARKWLEERGLFHTSGIGNLTTSLTAQFAEVEFQACGDTLNVKTYKARIAQLEAEAAANYALYEKKCTELGGTVQHIAQLEAALARQLGCHGGPCEDPETCCKADRELLGDQAARAKVKP